MKNATAQNASVATTVERQLSPAEIAVVQDRRDRLNLRLEESIAALSRVEDEFSRVESAEAKARRFLSLSESTPGFGGQRERAEEILAHCARRRAKVEPRLENRRRMVSEIRAHLDAILTASRTDH
jgi:hypothetical protein